ncbi:MAG: PKD domain-containing protein, partial [Myxococcales bacterium]|nr:PKD domain-containing protein [Myxococcales bacterium]
MKVFLFAALALAVLPSIALADPTAGFTYECNGLNCQFTDTSTTDDTITDWSWAFGDGEGSDDQSPSYTYAAAGTYEVSLLVVDMSNEDMNVQLVTVVVGPTAAYDFDCDDFECDFTDTSTAEDGIIVDWLWDFDDGHTSNDQNPAYEFQFSRVHEVSLTVTDDLGSYDTVTI